MSAREREARTLTSLVKLARAAADAAGQEVSEMEAAIADTDDRLRLLADAVVWEEGLARASDTVDFDSLSRFREGMARKQKSLAETRDKQAAALVAARANLQAAFAEMKKLEHLLESANTAAADRRLRADAMRLDEAARARHRRGALR